MVGLCETEGQTLKDRQQEGTNSLTLTADMQGNNVIVIDWPQDLCTNILSLLSWSLNELNESLVGQT